MNWVLGWLLLGVGVTLTGFSLSGVLMGQHQLRRLCTMPLTGMSLVGLSLVGVAAERRRLRRPGSNAEVLTEATQTPQQARLELEKASSETDPAVLLRAITHNVATGVNHYWPKGGAVDPGLRVPLLRNWVLHSLSCLDPLFERLGYPPHLFTHYEYLNYVDGLERGVGLCSQVSIVAADFINRRTACRADIVDLQEHVVVQAHLPDGRRHILDPDYDVVLPFGLQYAERHPDAVRLAYADAGYPEHVAERLGGIYGSAGNRTYVGGPAAYKPTFYRIERLADWIQWLTPILLMVVGGMLL